MDINFEKPVLDNFDFLCKEYFFRVICDTGKKRYESIRYENDNVLFEIKYNHYSYEIDLIFYQKEIGIEVNLSELECFYGSILDISMASNQNALNNCIKKISNFIRCFTKKIILGDPFTYRRIYKFSKEKNVIYNEELRMVTIRNKLSELWLKKKYFDVVKLLLPVENKLTPTEVKKLEYAKKHIDQ